MKSVLKTSALLAIALAGLTAVAACQKAAPNAAATPPPVATNAPPVVAASSVVNTDAVDAKAFLEGVYAHYKTSKNNNFQPFDGNAKEVLDADTIALFKADQKVMKGEVGAIDTDWLCDCQDFESLAATVTVQSASATEAKATAEFRDTGMTGDDAKPRHDTFDLVKTPDGWRIHDMGTRDEPSLRKVLQDEIAHPPKD